MTTPPRNNTASQPLLRVRGLCKSFPVERPGFWRRAPGEVRVVDGVSFDLLLGETLGVVGESGSGKTTMVRCLLRALHPTSGSVEFQVDGRTVDLAALSERELRPLRPHLQMVFQDPYSSLNPRMTVGDIVAEPLVIHRMAGGRTLTERVEQMLVQVGLEPEHRHRYPHAFSGGQRQRIGIARALIMNPSLVVADEAVSALDMSVQAQVINLLQNLQERLALTCIIVAHDLAIVRHLCTRVAVMYAGRIVELAPAEELFTTPKHPYTQMLIAAMPGLDPTRRTRFDAHGEVADPAALPAGCSFHPRCAACFAPCAKRRPELLPVAGGGRLVACHLHGPQMPSIPARP
jgi:peptide/nickel transport system ATP-binding protein